eukprot:955589-Pelagomonas_calceolata.AAC.5
MGAESLRASMCGCSKPWYLRVCGCPKPWYLRVCGCSKPWYLRVCGCPKPWYLRVCGCSKPWYLRVPFAHAFCMQTMQPHLCNHPFWFSQSVPGDPFKFPWGAQKIICTLNLCCTHDDLPLVPLSNSHLSFLLAVTTCAYALQHGLDSSSSLPTCNVEVTTHAYARAVQHLK